MHKYDWVGAGCHTGLSIDSAEVRHGDGPVTKMATTLRLNMQPVDVLPPAPASTTYAVDRRRVALGYGRLGWVPLLTVMVRIRM